MTVFSKILRLFLGIFCILFIVACDANMASPEDVMDDNSVSIASFTVDNSTLTSGQSAILKWTVTDEEDKVQVIKIEPDVGTVADSGSTQVAPDSSTTYTLDVYVDDQIATSRNLLITVLDAEGNEVETPPAVAEICDDSLDNDTDGAYDCDDEDCLDDEEACPQEQVETTYSLSYTLTNSDDIELTEDIRLTAGDWVNVNWTCDYDWITLEGDDTVVSDDAKAITYNCPDSYGFYTTSTTQSFNILGWVDGDLKGTTEVTVTADEAAVIVDPELEAAINYLTASPSKVLYGMPYEVSWSVDGAPVIIKLNGDDGQNPTDTLSVAEAKSSTTYELYVEDQYGNNTSKEVSVTVSFFAKPETSPDLSDLIQMVPTKTKNEFYFVSATGIAKSTDAGQTVAAVATSGWTGEITTFAVDKNGYFYLGTTDALYYSTTGSAFTQIGTAGDATFTALFPMTGSDKVIDVLVGTKTTLYRAYQPSGTKCDDNTTPASTGFCTPAYPFAGRTLRGDFAADPVEFYSFVVNLKNRDEVIAMTSAGTFLSTDEGETFPSSANMDTATDGYWKGNTGYLWNHDNGLLWVYDRDSGGFEAMSLDGEISGINFALEEGDTLFVAADNGVYYKTSDGLWYASNLATEFNYLITEALAASDSSSDGETHGESIGLQNVKLVPAIDGIKNKMTAVSHKGSVYNLEWSSSFLAASFVGIGF